MPRRTKGNIFGQKKRSDDPKFYTKNGELRENVMRRLRAREEADEKLKGTVLTKPWRRKGNGPFANIELVPPPFLRAEIRDQNFGDGSRRTRLKTDGTTDRPYTKPSAGAVRHKRRSRNAIAKASRRANRPR